MAIHENNSISNIDKFSCLKTFLCDSANVTISGLSILAANYVQAIELLKDRYGNSQVLISAYMEKFVLLPKIKNDDDIRGLRSLYDQIESNVRNLQILKVDTSSYSSLFVPLINEKLPTDIRVIIARKFKSEVWDLNEMIEVLKLEIDAKELSVSLSTSYVDRQENEFSYEKFSSSALYSNHASFVKGNKATSCVFCGSKHSSNRCLFISESSPRKKLIKQKGFCFVCLKEGHLANTCSEKYSCGKCHGRHNIAICTFSKPAANPVNNISH